MARRANTVQELLDRWGETYAAQAGIKLKNTPAPLFQLLVLAELLSARIRSENAVRATAALKRAGLTTPRKMAEASWQRRVDVLTANGYKRFDESASRMLGENAEKLLAEYGGDLRRLREAAGRDPKRERRRLQGFKGIGQVGADIFMREVQSVWPEAYPFADDRVRRMAKSHGLPANARKLAHYVERQDYPRLLAALLRGRTKPRADAA